MAAIVTCTCQVDQTRDNELSQLAVRQKLLFQVSYASLPLSMEIVNAVKSAISTAKTTASMEKHQPHHDQGVMGISSMGVDKAIRSFRQDTSNHCSFYLIYSGIQDRYEYVHGSTDGSRMSMDSPHEASTSGSRGINAQHGDILPTDCGYIGWVGEHDKYAWLDLGAHVSGWGPKYPATGIVSPSTIPDILAATTSATMGGNLSSLYSKLAALVHRTASHLMLPPLLFTPGGLDENLKPVVSPTHNVSRGDYTIRSEDDDFREKVTVQMYLVCEVSPCLHAEDQTWAQLEQLLQEPAAQDHTDRVSNKDTLMPDVKLSRKNIDISNFPLLATGLYHSKRSNREDPSAAAPYVIVSKELRKWLLLFLAAERLQDPGDIESKRRRVKNHSRIVPLFVISIDSNAPVLLEHSARSTAYPDMVISVSSRASHVDSAFMCGGRRVVFPGNPNGGENNDGTSTDALLRETVASLAQVIWGVGPRALAWDPLTRTFSTDFLWATGASMHTPLSSYTSVTFNERDAYLRTRILQRVDTAISVARHVLKQTSVIEPALALALNARDNAGATKSWNGFRDNMQSCLKELSFHNHEQAIGHVKRLNFHVENLVQTLSRGYKEGVHRAVCSCDVHVRGSSWISDAIYFIATLLLCVALFVRCRCLTWRKTKRS